MTVFTIIPALIPLAVIGAIIYGIFLWSRRTTSENGPDTGIGTPRRFYFYSISFIALMLLVSGVMIVLMSLLDELFGEPVFRGDTGRLAVGLALTIVGLPLWGLHWRFVQRSTAAHESEHRSILRKLYLYAAIAVALGFLAYGGYRVFEWALLVGDFPALSWAAVLVWGPVWAYHWWVVSSETPETTVETLGIRRLYLYVASALGVAMIASGLGFLVYFILNEGYSAAFQISISGSERLWGDAARTALSVAVVGGVIWWGHWFRFAFADRGSVLRWIYLFIATIGGGTIAALVGLGVVLHTSLVWVLGASSDPAASHFSVVPGAIATLAVGVALWTYFRRRMIDESASDEVAHVARTYDLLIAAIGLLTVASASVALLDTFLRLISDSSPLVLRGDVQWRSRVALILTLLVIGAPVWWAHWRRVQIAALSDPEVERTALPRKLYVMGVLCLGLLALVGGASSTLFIFLRDLLDVDVSANTLRDLSTGLSVVLTALLVIPYHWVIYRQDRELEPDAHDSLARPIPKSVLLLTAAGGSEVAAQVESALGYTVTRVQWPDSDAFVPSLDFDRMDQLAEEIASAPGTSVMLVPDADWFRVISYH